ncbi:MAG: hypothetical protein LBL13_00965 [Bacteroidales bacterium]|jgi:hypothetical protein|nr:hypothetical protein [Bacteroidales bacterium]
MTHSHGTIKRTDADFLNQANTIAAECNAHKTDWNIDDDRLNGFIALLTNANNAYTANNNLAIKNAITSANKKAAFGELKHALGPFVNYLEVNSHVPDAALAAMGLRPRHHPSRRPLPRPTEQPVISVRKQHDEMTVYAQRPGHDQPNSTVASAHAHGFMLRHKMEGDAQYQTTVSTRLHHTLFFERTDEGKRLYLAAAWINPRFEEGPWSEEISEIIT